MIRQTFAAAALFATTATIAAPVFAQDEQERLDSRYDRALAAGYKALMLCSAIGNSDPTGMRRSAASVEQWELTGIDPAFDPLVRDLPHTIVTGGDGLLDFVAVEWVPDMPPRIAAFRNPGGCAILPMGSEAPVGKTTTARIIDRAGTLSPQPPQTSGRWADLAQSGFAADYGEGARTSAVLLQRGGQILGEAFAPGFDGDLPQRTWSVAKSLAATIVGAAVHRGEADVGASAGLGEDETDPRRAITLDHLLRMASGRYSDTPGNRTDPLYWGGTTVDERAANWPMVHPPGSTYRYANNDTLMAVKAIEDTFADHPPAEMFARLGMHHTVAETDWQGDYALSSQVWTTARDLAEFGQLYLDDGKLLSGERILPEGWIEYVSAPSGPQPEGRSMGYGAGFWLFNQTDGIPADTFAAMGNRGQYVVIVPSRDVVIVRRGEDPAGSRFDILGFTRDVLAALGE